MREGGTHTLEGKEERKSQVHKVQKHISVEEHRAAGVSLHFSEWSSSSLSYVSVKKYQNSKSTRQLEVELNFRRPVTMSSTWS